MSFGNINALALLLSIKHQPQWRVHEFPMGVGTKIFEPQKSIKICLFILKFWVLCTTYLTEVIFLHFC